MADIRVIDQGTVVGFEPVTDDGRAWIDDNVHSEGWQWMGNILYVDHRMADDLINAMCEALVVG